MIPPTRKPKRSREEWLALLRGESLANEETQGNTSPPEKEGATSAVADEQATREQIRNAAIRELYDALYLNAFAYCRDHCGLSPDDAVEMAADEVGDVLIRVVIKDELAAFRGDADLITYLTGCVFKEIISTLRVKRRQLYRASLSLEEQMEKGHDIGSVMGSASHATISFMPALEKLLGKSLAELSVEEQRHFALAIIGAFGDPQQAKIDPSQSAEACKFQHIYEQLNAELVVHKWHLFEPDDRKILQNLGWKDFKEKEEFLELIKWQLDPSFANDVSACLATLDDLDRRMFYLTRIKDIPAAIVATAYELTVTAVYKRSSRAAAKLAMGLMGKGWSPIELARAMSAEYR